MNVKKIKTPIKLPEKNVGSKTEIIEYRGSEGLLQITLNSLKAKDGIYIYEISSMNEFIKEEIAEEIRREFVKRKIKIKQLTNHAFLEPWTKVDELIEKYQNIRYIDPKKFEIKTEILIYNDVVAIYDFRDETLGVEIYNSKLAEMHKQIFEFIWSLAEKPIIGKGGRTSIF